jgi:hypothetical protein
VEILEEATDDDWCGRSLISVRCSPGVRTGRAHSRSNLIAPLSAAVAGLGVVTFSSLSLVAAPAAVLAIVAGTLGVIRDRRTAWRVLAGASALAAFFLAAVSAIVILVLSAGGPTT